MSPMLFQTAFNSSSVGQRLVCRFSGLRLVALRWFVLFLASSPCVASASSYFFASTVLPRWRCAFSQFAPVAKFVLPVLASGSNRAVKPTRLRRAAYFRSLVPSHSALCSPPLTPALRMSQRLSSLFGLWRPFIQRHLLSFLQRCAASVAQRFLVGCALLQGWAPPFGLRV